MEGRERKQTLLNSLNSLSVSPANKSFIESKYEPGLDPLGCLDDDDETLQSNVRTEYFTHHVEDRVHVFQVSYSITDPILTMSYTVEVIDLLPFLPRQVTPLVTATFWCTEDQQVLSIGCTKGYICQYNLRHRNLQIVSHGMHSIDSISCNPVLQGTFMLLRSEDQIAAVLIPSEGFSDCEFDLLHPVQLTDDSADGHSASPELRMLDDSVWTECSSESETQDVSFLPSESLFESLPSTDIIAPSSLQTDNFLEETAISPQRSCFFQEKDIALLTHTPGQAFVADEISSTLFIIP